jgi:hypothetical protein
MFSGTSYGIFNIFQNASKMVSIIIIIVYHDYVNVNFKIVDYIIKSRSESFCAKPRD